LPINHITDRYYGDFFSEDNPNKNGAVYQLRLAVIAR